MYEKNAIKEVIEDLSDRDYIELNNQVAEEERYFGEIIYSMSEFDEMFANKDPRELVEMGSDGFNLKDSYFAITDLGDVKSSNNPRELGLDEGDLANMIENSQETYGVSELEDLMEASCEEERE